jgi:hypothetical protein
MQAKFVIDGERKETIVPDTQNVNVAITCLDCATDGGGHPCTFVKQSLTLKNNVMTTKNNDRPEQQDERRTNAPSAPADLNRTDAHHDSSKAQSQEADSKENRGNWDTEGRPTDDRPEGQANEGDQKKESGQHEHIGYRPNQTGDDRINKRPTDPGRPSASADEDENEVGRKDHESGNDHAREERDRKSGSDQKNDDEAGKSDFDQQRGDETSQPVR